jgi:hypothetical protein
MQILLLHNVFGNEMTRSADVYFHLPSFNIIIPEVNPIHEDNAESGIYVIRHMQYHGQKWYTQVGPDMLLLCVSTKNIPMFTSMAY